MVKKAQIRQGGFFKKGQVIITTVKKDGTDGESKVYTVNGKVKIESATDGKFILHFASLSGGSFGVSNRGTVSGRTYTRRQDIVVDEITDLETSRGTE